MPNTQPRSRFEITITHRRARGGSVAVLLIGLNGISLYIVIYHNWPASHPTGTLAHSTVQAMPTSTWGRSWLRVVASSCNYRISRRWCRSQSLEGQQFPHLKSSLIAPHPRRTLASRNPVPRKEDLPAILTAAGMVKLCGLPENRTSPLIGLDVAPSK